MSDTTVSSTPLVLAPLVNEGASVVLSITMFNKSTGQIVGTGQHSGGASFETSTIGEVGGLFDPTLYYVDTTQTTLAVTLRPTMALTISGTTVVADGKASIVITGVPNGATATLGSSTSTITDGEVDLSMTDAGTYTLVLSLFPYLDSLTTITATAASATT